MKKLINGIMDFRRDHLAEYRSKYAKLALQQSPDALFVACCDSRVVPNVFASSDPGELFVMRNIGNLIPPHQQSISTEATIDFSLQGLNVKDIIICGHSDCGAMQALIDKQQSITSLNKWLEFAAPSYARFLKSNLKNSPKIDPCNLLSMVNVLQQLDNLKTYPEVAKRLENKELNIHGWWFDLATANVYHYDREAAEFVLFGEKP